MNDARILLIEARDFSGNPMIKLVQLAGVLDTVTVEDADKIFNPFLDQQGLTVLVDCSRLKYMNSTGLANLMRYYIQLKRRQGALKLVAPSHYIKEIINVSGAFRLLEVYGSQQEAIESIKK